MATRVKLPPLPWAQLSFDSVQWQDWFKLLRKLVVEDGYPWLALNFTGSNLTDIVTRNHDDLQNISGGTIGEYNHLTDIQQALVASPQTANRVLAGPSSGSPAVPVYRTLVTADIPFGHLYDYQTPATGFSYTIPAGVTHSVLNPSGTLASGTITMPASPTDGQINTVSTTQVITALTVNPNTGQSITNAPTTLQLNANTPGNISGFGFQYIYRAANTTWYRLY
jgi:hypothetical protein